MAGRKSSVYLTEEILEGLEQTGLTVTGAIRAGIESRSTEKRALRAALQAIVDLRDGLRTEAAQRREIGTQLAGTTGSSDFTGGSAGSGHGAGYGGLEPRRSACLQCSHPDHPGDCRLQCDLCIENAAYAIREEIRARIAASHEQQEGISSHGTVVSNCSDQCNHDAGRHVPAGPAARIYARQRAADDETLDAVYMPPAGDER